MLVTFKKPNYTGRELPAIIKVTIIAHCNSEPYTLKVKSYEELKQLDVKYHKLYLTFDNGTSTDILTQMFDIIFRVIPEGELTEALYGDINVKE